MQRDRAEQDELKERQRLRRGKLQEHLEGAKTDYTARLDRLYVQLAEYAAMVKEPELERDRLRQQRQDHAQTISHAAKFDYEQ